MSIVYHRSTEVKPQLGYYGVLNDRTKARLALPPLAYEPLSPLQLSTLRSSSLSLWLKWEANVCGDWVKSRWCIYF